MFSLAFLGLFLYQITTTLACEGYELVMRKTELCEGVESILSLQNVSATLTEDCKVVTSGCATIKAFTSAKISYDILAKSIIPLKGDLDLCENMKYIPQPISTFMQSLNLSTACPIPETTVCGNEISHVDVSKVKEFLKLGEGTTRGEVKVTFDTGATCVIFDFKLQLKDGAKETYKTNLKELRTRFKELVKNKKAQAEKEKEDN